MRLHLWRVFGGFLTVAVAFLMIATNTRNLANAYTYIDPSPDWATLIALMIVGAMILALMFPTYQSARWVFLGLATSVVIAVAINAAPRLGLIDQSPLGWRWAILIGTTLPFPFVCWIAWVLVTHWISKPILALLPVETKTKTETKSDQNPKLLPESDRKSNTMPRIRIQRPRHNQNQNRNQNPTESNTETNSDTEQFRRLVLATLQREGKVAVAARKLKISPTMVNNHIQVLYESDPALVENAVPDWVERRKG